MKLKLALLLSAFSLQLSALGQIFNFPAQGPTTSQFQSLSNSVTYRTLFTTNSIYIAAVTNSTSYPTNNGDYSNITAFLTLSLPALKGTNSEVLLLYKYWPTNAEPNSTGVAVYLGSATNFIWAQNNSGNANGISSTGAGTSMFKNSRSMTNQVRMTAGNGSPALTTWNTFSTSPGYNLADTSATWTLRIGLFSASSATTGLA